MFATPNEFSMHIDSIVNDEHVSITTAILQYCEDNFLEPSEITKLVSGPLKEKLAVEMRQAGMLPEESSIEGL